VGTYQRVSRKETISISSGKICTSELQDKQELPIQHSRSSANFCGIISYRR